MKTAQWLGSIAVCALAFSFTSHANATTTVIDTTAPGPSAVFGILGEMGTSYYVFDTLGQTFTVADANTTLESFSFILRPDTTSPNPSLLGGYVMAWDSVNETAVGPILYRSSQLTLTAPALTPITLNTGGLALTQGQQYVLFISAAEHFNAAPDYARFAKRETDAYTGGQFYYADTKGDISKITTTNWDNPFPDTDLEFIASFSNRDVTTAVASAATPEPASAALIALGASMIGVTLRRRRQA